MSSPIPFNKHDQSPMLLKGPFARSVTTEWSPEIISRIVSLIYINFDQLE
jgi:hypothetical protein